MKNWFKSKPKEPKPICDGCDEEFLLGGMVITVEDLVLKEEYKLYYCIPCIKKAGMEAIQKTLKANPIPRS